MSRPGHLWFRFYVEAVPDPKLRRLTPAQRWLWVAVLAAGRQSPVPGVLLVSEREPMEAGELAEWAGMSKGAVTVGLARFERSGMIHRDSGLGCWVVTAWADRQYESDNVTARTAKHRAKERDGNVPNAPKERSGNVPPCPTGNAPETETDTDTETQPPPTPPEPTLAVVPPALSPPATGAGAEPFRLPEQVLAVWQAWMDSTGRAGSVLSDKRRKLIRAALRSYPPADVVDAVRGWRHSPHHRGENDRHTVYNDLELLLRDAQHIERFRDLERAGGGPVVRVAKGTAAVRRALERRSGTDG